MSIEELVIRLRQIKAEHMDNPEHGADPEVAHIEADKALLEYVNDPEVTELHAILAPWYA